MDSLLQTILSFINAKGWRESRRIVEEHPELLRAEVDSLMEELARKEEDEGVRERVEGLRVLLGRCREVGTRGAFGEKGRGRRGYVYAGLRVDLAEMERLEGLKLRDPQAIGLLVELYERILGHFEPGEQPLLCASVQNRLGNVYTQLPLGDRQANLAQAVRCYEEALRVYTLDGMPREYAATQNNLGSAYFVMQTGSRGANLARAIDCYEAALRIYTLQVAPRQYATTQTNLGSAYLFMPRGDRGANLREAIECFQNALRVWTPQATPNEYATAQNSLGTAYMEMPTGKREANLALAIECYRKALAVWTPATAPLNVAMAQNNLGNVYLEMPTGDREENLRRAIEYFQAALRFRTPESAPLDYAATQNNLGNAYTSLLTGNQETNLRRAIECYREALRFRSAKTRPFDYAMTHSNLGAAYLSLPTGDRGVNLTRAIECYREALRIYRAASVPDNYARSQNNLGTAYLELPTGDRGANLAQAIQCYREALRFRTLAATPREYAMIQHNLGTAYFFLPTGDRAANLVQAVECFCEALRVYTPQTAPFDYAMTQNNLGTTYLHLLTGERESNLARAIQCYQEALRFQSEEAAPFEYANIHNNLGLAYYFLPTGRREANLTRAIECYQETLRFRTAETAPHRYATQNNLGLAYQEMPAGDRQANLRQAIACHKQALRFRTPESSPLAYAMSQHNLGYAYSLLTTDDHKGALRQAIAHYQEALRFYSAEATPHNCRVTNRNLANLYFSEQDWEAVLTACRAAMDAGERLYRAGLSSESKASEVAENAAVYQYAAFASARLGDPTNALLLLERGKTRLLAEALRLRVRKPEGVPDEVWTAFEQAGAAVRATQSDGIASSTQKHDPIQAYAARIERVREANAALDAAIRRVRHSAPHFLKELDLEAIRTLIPDQSTALVAFCITNQGSIGLVLSSNNAVQMVQVPGFTYTDLHHLLFSEPDEPDRATSGWIVAYQSKDKRRWHSTIEQVLAEVGEKLLAPIMASLPCNIKKLLFLPSGGLFLLPLHAAPLSSNSPERLCDRYQLGSGSGVSYAPSAEVLADLQAKATQAEGNSLVAVINPESDPKLPFTPAEGAAIASLFSDPQVLMRRTGTKEAVINGVRGRAYLHFSCHGSYNWDSPPASALTLADGQLTLAELQRGKVDMSAARLVTLSACETGISDVVKGSPSEYVGLPAGFMLAGVPCVVSSLWEVPDLSTALLMERFYRNHLERGMDFTAALHEAQQWVRHLPIGEVADYAEKCFREGKGENQAQLFTHKQHYHYRAQQNPNERPFAHPYYWAAFTVNGM